MPFVLSGFELGETQPINTGLGYSSEQFALYPSEKLPLFSSYAFNWTRTDNLVAFIRERLTIRAKNASVLNNDDPSTFAMGHADHPSILVFTRHKSGHRVSVIANVDAEHAHHGHAQLPVYSHNGSIASVSQNGHNTNGHGGTGPLVESVVMPVRLAPGESLVLQDIP